MLHFFYDSLDTLKKVKKPTRKEIRIFTAQVFVVVLVSAFIFFVLDNLRGNLYKQIFQTFGTQNDQTNQMALPSTNIEIPSVTPSTDQPIGEVPAIPPTAEGEAPTEDQPEVAPEALPDVAPEA